MKGQLTEVSSINTPFKRWQNQSKKNLLKKVTKNEDYTNQKALN